MDELEALNMLLRNVGVSPVNNINTPYPAAANARATLDRTRRKVLGYGWWFNIDHEVLLDKAADNTITLSSTVRAMIPYDTSFVVRNNKVYDARNQTYVIECDVWAKRLVRELEWDHMPHVIQEYCGYLAAADFVRDELEDDSKRRSLLEDAKASEIHARKQELEQGQYNMFNQSKAVQMRAGVRPYRRNKIIFHGDPGS